MDLLEKMDPELRDLFEPLPSIDNTLDLKEIRENLNGLLKLVSTDIARNDRVNTMERWVPGLAGAPDVHVKVYRPTGQMTESLPAILYIHAGGFFFGEIDITDPVCENYVDAIGCVVISVDYRLAPENPYPAAPEDCYGALRWMFESAKELGIDRDRIALCGASSGGCLAAAVALMARDRQELNVAFQLLIYPVLDYRAVTPSSQVVTNPKVWNKVLAERSWKAYLGEKYQDIVPYYASPAIAEDLSGLPPAYIAVCEIDLLRDEAIEYARRLCEAEVSTELHVFPGTFHAFEVCFPDTEISIRFSSEITTIFKRVFAK